MVIHTSNSVCTTTGRVEETHHDGEDAEIYDEGEREHTHGATDVVKPRSLQSRVEKQLSQSTKIHCKTVSKTVQHHTMRGDIDPTSKNLLSSNYLHNTSC